MKFKKSILALAAVAMCYCSVAIAESPTSIFVSIDGDDNAWMVAESGVSFSTVNRMKFILATTGTGKGHRQVHLRIDETPNFWGRKRIEADVKFELLVCFRDDGITLCPSDSFPYDVLHKIVDRGPGSHPPVVFATLREGMKLAASLSTQPKLIRSVSYSKDEGIEHSLELFDRAATSNDDAK